MTNKFVKFLMVLTVVVVAAYVFSAIMMTRDRKTGKNRREEVVPGNPKATSVIRNFQHIESNLDKIGWELSASQAELLANKATLTEIKMRFYTEDKNVISLEGDSGTINLKNNNISVKGNVEAIYNDTYHFFSDEVAWNAKQKQLFSPGPVRITGPEGEIRGTLLTARPYQKKFEISNGVTVELRGNPRTYISPERVPS